MTALTRHSHFLGHSSNVNCLRFGRKSGQVAATGGDDNMVNLWRMRERETKNIMSLSGHQSPVESLVFDPTERKLIAGSKAGSIKSFDLEAGKVSRTLKGHMSTCTTVDYHLYGDYVASGSLDTIVKVWDLRTKSCMQTFKGHKSEVTKVCFTPDGRWLTSGGMDGTIKIWDLTAGRMLREFQDHGGAITGLEFNPEEFILVSSSTDKTIRIWDVQNFSLIGVTPTDTATTTSVCHTVAEPHSGKYMISCSVDAVRVWSYETAIECHDSIACHKPKDVGVGEVQADVTMLEGMKVMGGTIQDAFVSIWILDLNQMRPFQQSSRSRQEPARAPPAVVSPPPVVHPRVTAEPSAQPNSARGRPPSGGYARSNAAQSVASSRPITPGVMLPPSSSAPTPAQTPQIQGNGRINHVDDPRKSAPRLPTPEVRPTSSTEMRPTSSDKSEDAVAHSSQPSAASEELPTPPAFITTDYIMELRCGMDTSVKTFRARQKAIQELLTHWERGNLNEGLRFLAQLPPGKREAVVVDVLRTTDLQTLGIDLEACVLLLPLVVNLFASKFEAYLGVAIESGQRLYNAFSPVVKDSRDGRQFQSRGVNLAGEERSERCSACDVQFQEMFRLVQALEQKGPFPSLTTKLRALSRSMADFCQMKAIQSRFDWERPMRRRYDRRRAAAAAKAAAAGDATSASTQTKNAGDAAAAPLRRLSLQMKLHVHGPEFQNGDELVLNPEFFPALKDLPADKYVVEIFHATDSERLREETAVAAATPFSDPDYLKAHSHLLLDVPPSNETPPKGKWQVSVFKDTAAAFQLAAFNDATVRFVEKSRVELNFVEISLKDQFLSRRDLWYLKQSLVGMALYVGKNVRVQGTRWQVMDLRANGDSVRSGVISKTTKFAFRSRTSRVMWLAQMSPEMWDMANSGKLYMEIFLQLVQNVLNKWIKHKVSHSLTIILFARSYYPELDTGDRDVGYGALRTPPRSPYPHARRSSTRRVLHHGPSFAVRQSKIDSAADSAFPFANKSDDMWAIGVDEDGRHYQDFYKIVAFDSAVTDVQPLLVQLKQEMNEFPDLCGWRSPRSVPSPVSTGLPGDVERPPGAFPERRHGVPSNARDGNLLEAVNLVLNIFEKHHIDRHLERSGQSVVLITAGNGIFRVKQRLAEITEQRMMDHGIGIDMISLSTPPLHKCPLFLFKQSEMSELTLPTRVDGMEPISGGNGHDVCTCGAAQPPAPTARASVSTHRRSRTGSSDHGENPDPLLEQSLRGGVQSGSQQPQTHGQAPWSQGGMCKHCVARNATRKRYEVPLWIPLSFVQERMMIDHKCPLDADISNSCSICCPIGMATVAGFEPLPMCRMFNDVATWQDPPRNSRPTHSYLPKPLERLLNHFQDPNASLALKPDDGIDNDIDYLQSRTFSSDFSLMLDNDYLSLGRDSELVRARAPSLASLDGDDIALEGAASLELPKVRSFSPDDVQKVRREFEGYDDAVFRAPLSKKTSKYSVKYGGGGEDDSQAGNNRYLLTPPLRPNGSGFHQAPLSTKKSSARMTHTASMYQHQSSSGGGDDALAQRHPSEPSRWRSPQNAGLLTTSPGPPSRMSVHSEGKIRPAAADINGDEGTPTLEGADPSSPDIALTRTRTLGGSLPNTFQLLAAGDGGTYANSPILLPLGDNSTKDPLFHSHAYIYKQLTSNQRRWSQVRASDGKNPYRLVQSVLKWKSLCCPALLPLTTDFVPGSEELKKHYSESFYSVTLPERDEQSGVTFRDYRELVMEMVAQRFSQDFQLVTMEATKTSSKSHSVLFRLTMGHRIHEIKYNEETQTVDVKRYLQRASARSDVDIMEYRYSLWSPVADRFLFASQEFRKYPRHEYQWNYLDQLICGYYDDMNDAIRYKRILFCIMPPQLTGEADQDEPALKIYTDRCRKFFDSLKSKAADAASFPSIKIASEWRSGIHRSGAAAFKHVSRENVRMVLHASDSPSSQNWLVTRLDTELMASQSFHMEVQWLVCRSALVEDYIQGLVRRAKQLGLDFMQVPENGVSNDLDLHPLVCPIFLPLSDPTEQRLVEATLVDRLSFCCETLHVIPRVHLNHGDAYTILDVQPPNERRRIRFYRQYVHRTLACFVRVTQTGLVWISNRKLQCRDIQPVYEAIRDKVESVGAANAALKEIVSDVQVVVEKAAAMRIQQQQEEGMEEKATEDATTITPQVVELQESEVVAAAVQPQAQLHPCDEHVVESCSNTNGTAGLTELASEKESQEAAAIAVESVVDPPLANAPAGDDQKEVVSLPSTTSPTTVASVNTDD